MAAMLGRTLPVLLLLGMFVCAHTDEKFVIRSINSTLTLDDNEPNKSHDLTYLIKPWPPDWRVSNSTEFEAYKHVWIHLYNDTTSQLLCQAQYEKGVWKNESLTDSCWTRSGERISNFEPSMIGDTVEFRLNSVSLWDMNSYSLKITDFFNKQYTGTVRLTVRARPMTPIITISKEGDLDEGDNVTLTCATQKAWPPPDLQWLRDTIPIDRTTTVHKHISTTWWGESKAHFSWPARKEDHGIAFNCKASNGVGNPLKSPHIMKVTFRPQVLIIECEANKPYAVMEGKYAALHCDVTKAYPGVHMWIWVSPNGDTISTNKTKLETMSVNKTDAGNYSCHAVNAKGRGLHWCVVDVQYGVTITLPANITFKEFEKVRIPCRNEANPKPIEYKWTKIGDSRFEFPNETLKFNSVRPEHGGVYKCAAKNFPVGETWRDNGDIQLLVEYKPRLANYSLTKYASRLGHEALLKCVIRAYPAAKVSWRFMDQDITNGPRHIITTDQSASTLEINAVLDTDFGPYKCGATNPEGLSHFDINLLKPGKPDPPQMCDVSKVTDRDVTLTCIAGYAGGEQLTFRVSSSADGQDSSEMVDVEVTWPEIYELESGVMAELKVSGFGPNTNYTLLVYGANKHGHSSSAISLLIRTADGPPLPTYPPPDVGAIVGGVFGGLLVIIIIVGAALYVCKYGTPEVPNILRRKFQSGHEDRRNMMNRMSSQGADDVGQRYAVCASRTRDGDDKETNAYASLAKPNRYVLHPANHSSVHLQDYTQQGMADQNPEFRQYRGHQGNYEHQALGYGSSEEGYGYSNYAYANDEQEYANEAYANEAYANEQYANEQYTNKQYQMQEQDADRGYANVGRNKGDMQVSAEVYPHQDKWNQRAQTQRNPQSNLAGMGALAGSHVMLNYASQGRPSVSREQQTNNRLPLEPLMEGLSLLEHRHEYPRHQLSFCEKLGEGLFGEVWRAYAENLGDRQGRQNVAIKLIKESCPPEEQSSLWRELEVLKMLQPHPNVVSLLGACSDREPLFVILEYCRKGNLLDFLRKNRNVPRGMHPAVRGVTLTTRTLTCFVIQIANGMEYISSKGLLHRDLAARNVLMDDRLTCKISDFGFARDIAHTRQYEGKTQRRLPLRWMAPESLYDCIYSTQSDVWAFGVTVWEVMTLGSSPYPGMMGHDVMELINTGFRMEKPIHCSAPMYAVMWDCWRQTPQQRPSWSPLSMRLDAILEDLDDNPDEVINVNVMEGSMFAILTDPPGEKC